MDNFFDYKCDRIFYHGSDSDTVITEGISFGIKKGSSLAVIGESGSGKTMTAYSVMGMLPSGIHAEGLKISLDGRNLIRRQRSLLGNEIVYIPQSGLECLNPSRTVRKHLYDTLKKNCFPREELETAAANALRVSGFDDPLSVLDRYPFELSGGMGQRVVIAISACSHPRLIIADEPTNGLDTKRKHEFSELIQHLFPDSVRIVITHDISLASECEQLLVMCKGKIMEYGNAASILNSPCSPYTKALKAALPENGMHECCNIRRNSGPCPFSGRCRDFSVKCLSSFAEHRNDYSRWYCHA